jgi:hypothetical protein
MTELFLSLFASSACATIDRIPAKTPSCILPKTPVYIPPKTELCIPPKTSVFIPPKTQICIPKTPICINPGPGSPFDIFPFLFFVVGWQTSETKFASEMTIKISERNRIFRIFSMKLFSKIFLIEPKTQYITHKTEITLYEIQFWGCFAVIKSLLWELLFLSKALWYKLKQCEIESSDFLKQLERSTVYRW